MKASAVKLMTSVDEARELTLTDELSSIDVVRWQIDEEAGPLRRPSDFRIVVESRIYMDPPCEDGILETSTVYLVACG